MSYATTLDEVLALRSEVEGLRAWQRARLETDDLNRAEIERLQAAFARIVDGYGSNHGSKFCLDVARDAIEQLESETK